MVVLREYLWIAVCGGILGFVYGFLIGANDVANAFASSVSSKSITLKQAVGKFAFVWQIPVSFLDRTDSIMFFSQ
jgi:phosphate/sulfate permease